MNNELLGLLVQCVTWFDWCLLAYQPSLIVSVVASMLYYILRGPVQPTLAGFVLSVTVGLGAWLVYCAGVHGRAIG